MVQVQFNIQLGPNGFGYEINQLRREDARPEEIAFAESVEKLAIGLAVASSNEVTVTPLGEVNPTMTPEFQEAIKGKHGIEVGLVESAFLAGFKAASKKATPPAAANTPKPQENLEAIVKRVKAGEESMGKRDYSLPLWGIAGAIRQQVEYHQKNMGTSGESPDWEAGFIEGLKHTLTLIYLGVKAGVEQMKNDGVIADESLLAKYWDSPEEDAAWAHL